MTQDDRYAFPNSAEGQRSRLLALEAVLDPGTFRHLEALGVGPGWACLEVGAGGGSVARWLAARVGASGQVLATDRDLSAFGHVDDTHPSLRAIRHDVMIDPLPEASFDLVHLRLTLAWLPYPGYALARLVTALKPGGWLVAEDLDFASAVPDPAMDATAAAVVARVLDVHTAVLTSRNGFDPVFGRRLDGLLRAAGLVGVDATGQVSMWRGGEPGGELWRRTFQQLRDAMVATGQVDDSEVDTAINLCGAGLSFVSPTTMTGWGRRPGSGGPT